MGKMKEQEQLDLFESMVAIPMRDKDKILTGDLLAQDQIELEALIMDNKATNAEFKKEKKKLMDKIKEGSEQIASGKIYKKLECYWIYNSPTKGQKKLMAKNPDENPFIDIEVEVHDMTDEDNGNMFINEDENDC